MKAIEFGLKVNRAHHNSGKNINFRSKLGEVHDHKPPLLNLSNLQRK